jgi:hypothetical protein
VIHVTAVEIGTGIVADKELEEIQMKPRSTVTALLAITESLLAARAAKAAKRMKPAAAKQIASPTSKIGSLLIRPLWLRIKTAS